MSHSKWPMRPLEEVITHRKEFITIDDSRRYMRCRVQLHAKGVVLRDRVQGSDIKTKSQQVCRHNEFLVAEIDAKVGGFGMVPSELDGAVVSSHYFLFTPKPDRLIPKFLDYYSRTPQFRNQVAARGSTNYAAIRPRHVLNYVIPTPSIQEQISLVRRIEHLAQLIDTARILRDESNLKTQQLCRSLLRSETYGKLTMTPMRELVNWRKPDVVVNEIDSYHFAGVYCFGRGVFRGTRKRGSEFAYKTLTKLREGEFVYPKLMAWEGAMAVVPPECDGLFVSPEFPVFTIDKTRVLPEVLDVYFRSPSVWPQLSGASTGTNVRRRRLNPKDFLAYEFPLPSRKSQELLASVCRKVEDARRLQEPSVELDVLMPSILDRAFKEEL